MAKYIFYTFEGYTISPNETDLESIQILGIEKAKNLEDGIELLLENNSWIIESGFNIEEIRHSIIINSSDLENIKKIVDYLWKDEEKHFEECKFNNENIDSHIFNSLSNIKKEIEF